MSTFAPRKSQIETASFRGAKGDHDSAQREGAAHTDTLCSTNQNGAGHRKSTARLVEFANTPLALVFRGVRMVDVGTAGGKLSFFQVQFRDDLLTAGGKLANLGGDGGLF